MVASAVKGNEFDVIIVGSGTCGATIARELTRHKKRVLILERGPDLALQENLRGIVAIADEVRVGDQLKTTRALTTGGSTGLYFAVAMLPSLEMFRSLGIDLSAELAEAKRELPIAQLPDELLGPQALRLRKSALELGYAWKNNEMLIDQSKCSSGYCYEAKWKARDYVQDAIRDGATLVNRATVLKVLVENNRAVGVEYKVKGSGVARSYGAKIILAAGSLATPKILMDSGVDDFTGRGFYCDPGFVMFGSVPGLKARDNFVGCMTADLDEDIALGDANLPAIYYRLMMLSKLKLRQVFSFSDGIAVGVKVKDARGGALREDGSYRKQLGDKESKKLQKGEEAAVKILKNAGAKRIFHSGLFVGGHVGGVIKLNQDVDAKFETRCADLHVCDGSLLTEEMRMTPAITLVCLGKYLAKHLVASL